METPEGEPDVVGRDEKSGSFIFWLFSGKPFGKKGSVFTATELDPITTVEGFAAGPRCGHRTLRGKNATKSG